MEEMLVCDGNVQCSIVRQEDLPPLPETLLQWLAERLVEKEA